MTNQELLPPFHNLAFELYNDFVLTGGYPSAITSFNENKDYNLLANIHLQNMKLLKNKFLELDNLTDVKRCSELLDNVSFQLLKDNKKLARRIEQLENDKKNFWKRIFG